MNPRRPGNEVRVVTALRDELTRVARQEAAGSVDLSRPLFGGWSRVLGAGVALAACALLIIALVPGGGGEGQIARAAVEKLAPTLIPGVAASDATCESESASGVGTWHCEVSVPGADEPAELKITINDDGSYSSRAVGTPAVAGCCLPVEN
jgi:hypothetical protein